VFEYRDRLAVTAAAAGIAPDGALLPAADSAVDGADTGATPPAPPPPRPPLLLAEVCIAAAVFVAGILLLSADRGAAQDAPQVKSRRLNYVILALACGYAACEIIYIIKVSAMSVGGELLNPAALVGGLGFLGVLILLCGLGLRKVPPADIVQTADVNGNGNGNALDTEIATLKKEIEKRKLEDELKKLDGGKK
jgi:hypothetical protein